MAERRMFAKSVVLSGRFMKLPPVTQLLYFRLGMEADDDGFHNAPDFAMQGCGANRRDLKRLEDLGFVHSFESGVVVLLHWRVHNFIRKDRYRQTVCISERNRLVVGENGEYLLVDQVNQVDRWSTQDRIGKDRIGQDSSGQDRSGQEIPAAVQWDSPSGGDDPPRMAEVMCYAMDHGLSSDALGFYHHYTDLGWPDKSRYTWKRLLKEWEEDHAGTP